MRGLMPQNDGQTPAGPQQGPQQGGAMQPKQATPEQTAQYENFVSTAVDMISDPKVMPGILQSLKAGNDPVGALANTAAMITKRVTDTADKAGEPIDPAVEINAIQEILLALTEFAEASNIHKYEPQEVQKAVQGAMMISAQADKAFQGAMGAGQGPQGGQAAQPGAAPGRGMMGAG